MSADPWYDEDDDVPPTIQSVATPWLWLLLAVVLAVAAGAASWLVGHDSALSLAPWAVAGPVGYTLLALFTRKQTAAAAKPGYFTTPSLRPAYGAGAALVTLAVVAASYQVALWVAGLDVWS
jgi:hypothetical protein